MSSTVVVTNMSPKLLILNLFLFLFSCQAGTPMISALGEVSGFTINETVMTLKTKNNNDPFTMSGTCTGKLNDIQISFDNGTTYTSVYPMTTSYQENCVAAGTFSFVINPALNAGFAIPQNLSSKNFLFRGISDFGMTTSQAFRRQVSLGDVQITAGSVTQTVSGGGTFKGRITGTTGAVSDTRFIFQGSVIVK